MKKKQKIHWLSWERLCKSKSEGGLGFRDLQKFNDALLAKQVWSLIHNKNSLFYAVFSAKFFPCGNVLDTKDSIRGSYAWTSIRRAAHVIKKGMVWRIRDGNATCIWQDNWLPDQGHRKIISPCSSLPPDSKVSQSINSQNRTWNTPLLEQLFFPYDAEAIQSIPLSHNPGPDVIIWPHTRDGVYSVRSAYHLLQQEELSLRPSSSNGEAQKALWKKVWSLRLPPKVKSFLWRACSESLPTKLNLWKRKVLRSAWCERCEEAVEDTIHAIWHCEVNTQVWACEDWAHRFKGYQGPFDALATKILMDDPEEVAGRFAIIAWALWHERNKFRLTPYTSLPEDTHPRAIELWLEFLAENTPAETQKIRSPEIPWSPPPLGLYKANFDGAVFQDSHEAGLGVIIRDPNGLVIASLAQKIPFPGSVVMVEALAARRAVTFAIEVGTWKIEFEGDSEQIIKAINQEDLSFTPYGHII